MLKQWVQSRKSVNDVKLFRVIDSQQSPCIEKGSATSLFINLRWF